MASITVILNLTYYWFDVKKRHFELWTYYNMAD